MEQGAGLLQGIMYLIIDHFVLILLLLMSSIPERVVHARGAGAHGYFELYRSQEHLTSAKIFSDPSRRTPLFIRFSTVLGSKGSLDTARDVRGYAIKFYTEEGNWDLVGNNSKADRPTDSNSQCRCIESCYLT